ncbi:MAG: alpha/beta hydrolase [Gemmatimonadota bacterium]|jgi:pimeloyl-ACP methyl ester carboxylesterase
MNVTREARMTREGDRGPRRSRVATSDRSWFSEEPAARIADAAGVVQSTSDRYTDLDEWQRFNTPRMPDPQRALLYHGWFMSTPLGVVQQYWRENSLVDLNPLLAALDVPVLSLWAVRDDVEDAAAFEEGRRTHMRSNGAPPHTEFRFVRPGGHYVMEWAPEALDRAITEFVAGSIR